MPAVQQRDRHATSVEAKIILPEPAGLHRRGDRQTSLGTRRRVNHLQEEVEGEEHDEELVFSARPKKPVNEQLRKGLTEVISKTSK